MGIPALAPSRVPVVYLRTVGNIARLRPSRTTTNNPRIQIILCAFSVFAILSQPYSLQLHNFILQRNIISPCRALQVFCRNCAKTSCSSSPTRWTSRSKTQSAAPVSSQQSANISQIRWPEESRTRSRSRRLPYEKRFPIFRRSATCPILQETK
jgi:hypothetical protein